MSASLVGSEMCIRDRFVDPPSTAHGCRTPKTYADLTEHQRQEDATPVSYTHLTLPTICSV
eukprot:974378-Alexandrium_andersonii.AAC.1